MSNISNTGNNHVHPAFRDILAGMQKLPAIKCRVHVKTEQGEQTYDGLFESTVDAILDAQRKLGDKHAKFVVEVL